MGLREYEAQWQSILGNNMFTEEAVLTDNEVISFSVRGVFFSGSYEEEQAAAYAPKRLVNKEYFQVASTEIPVEIQDPWKTLEGFSLMLPGRDLSFRIYEVAGKRGGTLTLSLQETQANE